MKRLNISLLCGAAIAALAIGPAVASAPSVTGTWKVEQTGLNGTTTATITITQSGNGIVGNNASNGTGYTGEFVNETQINGKWHGPGGAGWLTIYVTPNGHSFNGTWGYNGRSANGSFVGNKVLPPSAVVCGRRLERRRCGRLERLRRQDVLQAVRSFRRLRLGRRNLEWKDNALRSAQGESYVHHGRYLRRLLFLVQQ